MLYFRRPNHLSVHGTMPPYIVLAYDADDVPPYSETEPNPIFRMDTYASMSKDKNLAAGESILRDINEFLGIFSAEEHKIIYQYYVTTKRLMDSINLEHNTVRKITDEITMLTKNLMRQLHFADRALALVEKTIPLPDLTYVGKEAHYVKDYSFYDNDYYHWTAVSLLCKFMCPVWGEFIACVKQPRMDPATRKNTMLIDERNNKELFCASMLLPSLETGTLSFIYNKLYNYMKNIIKGVTKSVQSSSSTTQPAVDFVVAKYGYDDKRFEDYVYSMLLVKRIVGFDPWQIKEDGKHANIITATNVVINRTAVAQIKRMRTETRTMTRNDISEGGGDTDNISQADNMSRISLVTADVPICIVFGVNKHVPNLIKQQEIPNHIYDEALEYYSYKMTESTIFNKAILASLHAHWVGGSALLQYLDFATHVKLLTYTQLYLIKHNYPQLAVYLTCRTRSTPLEHIRPEGQRISNNVETTYEYKQVCERYPGSAEKQLPQYGYNSVQRTKKELVEHVNIRVQIEKLQNWIIEYDHIAEIAPVVKELLPSPWKEKAVSDELLEYDERIVQQICTFFLEHHGNNQTVG